MAEEGDSMGDFWRDVKAARKQKRASNRKSSAELLRAAGIPFESNNDGVHLVVTACGKKVDFWPGTGLWIARGASKRGYGVRKLIAACTPAGDTA